MYKGAFIYNYGITGGRIIAIYQCVLLAPIGMVYYCLIVYCLWCVSMWTLHNYRGTFVTVWCTIISLNPFSCHIARHGFCSATLCTFNNPLILIVYVCH